MLKTIVRHLKLLTAIEAASAALLSFFFGSLLSSYLGAGSPLIGGLWAMISAVIIEHVKYKEMLKNAQIRILGTLVGAIISWLGFFLMGYHYWSFFICMLLSVMICAILRLSIYRLCCITVAIIFAVSQVSGYVNPWVNSYARFFESLVGILVTLILAAFFYLIREHYDLKEPM
jgi:uncharacterized membrane protein YgaE (UPF0421/DUF939 family)